MLKILTVWMKVSLHGQQKMCFLILLCRNVHHFTAITQHVTLFPAAQMFCVYSVSLRLFFQLQGKGFYCALENTENISQETIMRVDFLFGE